MFAKMLCGEQRKMPDATNATYQSFGTQNTGFERLDFINQTKNDNKRNCDLNGLRSVFCIFW